MGLFSILKQKFVVARFKRNDLRIIESIQPMIINAILSKLISEGWELAVQFETPESLNLQGECIIRRGQSTLVFTLNDDYADASVGAIEGPARIVNALASQQQLLALTAPSY
jgi:hypothetical protein